MISPQEWYEQQRMQQEAERLFGEQQTQLLGAARFGLGGGAASSLKGAVQTPTKGVDPLSRQPGSGMGRFFRAGGTALGAGASGLAAVQQARKGDLAGAALSGASSGMQAAQLVPGASALLQKMGGPLGLMGALHGSQGLARSFAGATGDKAPRYAAESTLLSGLQGAGTGAAAGSSFGPVGTAVGAGLGVLAGGALPAAAASGHYGSKFWKAAGKSAAKKGGGALAAGSANPAFALPALLFGDKASEGWDKVKDKIKDIF